MKNYSNITSVEVTCISTRWIFACYDTEDKLIDSPEFESLIAGLVWVDKNLPLSTKIRESYACTLSRK